MQAISKPVLATRHFHIGTHPVFIVAQHLGDALRLGRSLSEACVVPDEFCRISDEINLPNNYFVNDTLLYLQNQFLQGAWELKKQELGLRLSLAIEEGFANGKLWGMAVSYDFFWGAELAEKYPDGVFLMLYDDTVPAFFAEDILSLSEERPSATIVINQQQLHRIPGIIYRSLPLSNVIRIKDSISLYEKDQMSLAVESRYEKLVSKSLADEALFAAEEEINLLRKKSFKWISDKWLFGPELSVILLCSRATAAKTLNKIQEFTDYFSASPEFYIVCYDEPAKAALQELDTKCAHAQVISTLHGFSKAINNLLRDSHGRYVVMDNLIQEYDLADILGAVTTGECAFATACPAPAVKATRKDNNLTLRQLLTSMLAIDNLAFGREDWRIAGGLDEALTGNFALWDFGIRLIDLQKKNGRLIYASGTSDEETTPLLYPDDPQYKTLLGKHKAAFASILDDVISMVTESQHLPQNEIRALQSKLSASFSLLDHSKDEVKALNELAGELQRRVVQIESRWYFRLGKKIKKIKKIFFKKQTGKTSALKRVLKFLAFATSRPGLVIVRKMFTRLFRMAYLATELRTVRIQYLDERDTENIETYQDWILNKLDPEKLQDDFDAQFEKLTHQPLISIVMPVFDPPAKFLKQAIESVISQSYPHWQLCIADDCSPNPKIRRLLQVYASKDPRIEVVFRTENGHLSASSNSALQMAKGEYVLLMDHDDLITPNCLFEVVKHINAHPSDKIIYSDEDKINEAGHHSVPHFKPDWSPHNLLSRNYLGHVVVIKKEIVDRIGGFRLGFEGSQDYDLLLRATEETQEIGHIPKVLYHWRIHSKSAAQSEEVKPYAYIAAKKALEEALIRRNLRGNVSYLSGLRGYRISYEIDRPGKVSIIIPTKDQVKLLKNTIDSIIEKTSYQDFEIILLDNNSKSSEFFELVKYYEQKLGARFLYVEAKFPFNFARLMNLGVSHSTGDYILFLNNDVEIIQRDWLTKMVSYAQLPQTAAVGVKLLYPDDHIQHAGVIIGLGGVAGHAFVNFFKDEPGYFNYVQTVNNFSAVTAACMIFRREIYEQVGGMDESFEVEYNDVDLCLKFLEAGYYNVYLPDVELYHYESATRGHPHQSKESWNRHVKEIGLFKQKWQRYIDHDPCYNPNLNLGVHDFGMDFSA